MYKDYPLVRDTAQRVSVTRLGLPKKWHIWRLSSCLPNSKTWTMKPCATVRALQFSPHSSPAKMTSTTLKLPWAPSLYLWVTSYSMQSSQQRGLPGRSLHFDVVGRHLVDRALPWQKGSAKSRILEHVASCSIQSKWLSYILLKKWETLNEFFSEPAQSKLFASCCYDYELYPLITEASKAPSPL